MSKREYDGHAIDEDPRRLAEPSGGSNTMRYLEGVLGVLNAVFRARGQVGVTPREVVAGWQLEAAHDHEYELSDRRFAMTAQSQVEPRRWMLHGTGHDEDLAICVEPEAQMQVFDHVAVREDRALAADIEAISMRLADIAPDGNMFARKAWCDEKAELIAAAVFREGVANQQADDEIRQEADEYGIGR